MAIWTLAPFLAGWGGTCPRCPPGSYAYALNPFTATVLSSVSGITGAAGDGVSGGGWEGVGVAVGGATAAAIYHNTRMHQKHRITVHSAMMI